MAKLAGTSPAVVSYVLNNGPRPVARDTRARVLDAVEKLGYRPNGIARSLRMQRTMTLGLVLPDIANPFFAELSRAVEEAAFARGYTLLIGNAAEDPHRQTGYVRTFLDRQVDGLFLVPAHGPLDCFHELARSGTPWVAIDRHPPNVPDASEVHVDHRDGARRATLHLLEHGRTKIACVAGPSDVRSATDRVAGWFDALQESTTPNRLLQQVPFGRLSGYAAATELLAECDVDSFFVASDEQALGVMRAITESGRTCPQDVAVVSFDGIADGGYVTPSLTTMAQPFSELGATAMDLLLARLNDPEMSARKSVLRTTLVIRDSCGCTHPNADSHKQSSLSESGRA